MKLCENVTVPTHRVVQYCRRVLLQIGGKTARLIEEPGKVNLEEVQYNYNWKVPQCPE